MKLSLALLLTIFAVSAQAETDVCNVTSGKLQMSVVFKGEGSTHEENEQQNVPVQTPEGILNLQISRSAAFQMKDGKAVINLSLGRTMTVFAKNQAGKLINSVTFIMPAGGQTFWYSGDSDVGVSCSTHK